MTDIPKTPGQKAADKRLSVTSEIFAALAGWSIRPGNEHDTFGCAELWFGDHLAARIERGDRSAAIFRMKAAIDAYPDKDSLIAAYCIGLVQGMMMPSMHIGDTKGNVVGRIR